MDSAGSGRLRERGLATGLVAAEPNTLLARAAAAVVIERSSSLAATRDKDGGERATMRRPKEIRFLFVFAGDALIAC